MLAMVFIGIWLSVVPTFAIVIRILVAVETLFTAPLVEFTAADKASLAGAIHGGAL